MSLLARLLRPQDAIASSEDLARYLRSGAGQLSESGAVVNELEAMQVAAVYACVRVLAEGVAGLPLIVYRREGRRRVRATDHWAYRLLHDAPNPWQTSMEFREMLQAHLALRGRGFALKTVVGQEVRELLPLHPDRVTVTQYANYRLTFKLRQPDGTEGPEIPQDRMLYLRGLSLDGVNGISPLTYQRETLGAARQLQRQGARLFKNGMQVTGVLKHPEILSEDAATRLRDQFDEIYAGSGNAGKTMLLEQGLAFEKIGMTAEDAQFLETRKITRSEIAGAFRVPSHMINDLERATFSNIEQQGIGYVVHTLGPWLTRWEQRLALDILPPADRATLYPEFLVEGLLRGDTASRFAAYQVAVTTGWMNRNEVRERENLDPVEGLDEFLTPQNITGKPGGAAPPSDPPADPAADPATDPPPRRRRTKEAA